MKPTFLMKPVLIMTAVVATAATLTAAPVVEGPEQASWNVLDAASHSGDFAVRQGAVLALETTGPQNLQAVDRLVVYLQKDKDPRVRKAAALALGRMKAERAIPALHAALKDVNEVAFAAAQALMNLGDPAGQQIMVEVLSGRRSAEPGIMTNARREAGKRMRHPGTLAYIGATTATGAAFGPAVMGVEAARQAHGLRGKPTPGKVAAVECLAKDPNPYAVTVLEWALGNSNPTVRAEAAESLGQRGTSASIRKLQPLLYDRHNSVRTMAAASIICLSHPAGPHTLAGAAPMGTAAASVRP